MPVFVIDTIKPKNGGSFPIVEAIDVFVDGYSSLADAVTNFATLDIIDDINDALSGKANSSDVIDAVSNLQGQINQIVISSSAEAVVAPEVADARVGEDGTEYTTLKERLDAENAEINDNISRTMSELYGLPNIEAYNPNNITKGYFLGSDGTPSSSSNWGYTDKMKIDPSKPYTYSGLSTVSSAYCCYYNSVGEFIDGTSFRPTANSNITVTDIPENAASVAFSVYKDDFDTFSLTYKLFETDNDDIPPSTYDLPYIRPYKEEDVTQHYYLNDEGTPVYQANWGYSGKIKIDPSKPYTYSGISTAASAAYCWYYNSDGELISGSGFRPTANAESTVTDIPSNASFVSFSLYKDDFSTFSLSYKLFETAESVASVWNGANYISHGDSITYYDGHEYPGGGICKGYQSVMNDLIGFASVTNEGRSGYPMADREGHYGIVSTILNTSHSAYQLITIFAGTNDFKLGIPMGSLGSIGDVSLNRMEFYGAYRTAIEHILSQNAAARIVLMTPPQRNNDGYSVNTVNTAGYKLIDYVNAIKNVGQMYGIPVCDLFSNSGFTQLTLSAFTIDGLHPNNAGHRRIGEYLTAFVNAAMR